MIVIALKNGVSDERHIKVSSNKLRMEKKFWIISHFSIKKWNDVRTQNELLTGNLTRFAEFFENWIQRKKIIVIKAEEQQ